MTSTLIGHLKELVPTKASKRDLLLLRVVRVIPLLQLSQISLSHTCPVLQLKFWAWPSQGYPMVSTQVYTRWIPDGDLKVLMFHVENTYKAHRPLSDQSLRKSERLSARGQKQRRGFTLSTRFKMAMARE